MTLLGPNRRHTSDWPICSLRLPFARIHQGRKWEGRKGKRRNKRKPKMTVTGNAPLVLGLAFQTWLFSLLVFKYILQNFKNKRYEEFSSVLSFYTFSWYRYSLHRIPFFPYKTLIRALLLLFHLFLTFSIISFLSVWVVSESIVVWYVLLNSLCSVSCFQSLRPNCPRIKLFSYYTFSP